MVSLFHHISRPEAFNFHAKQLLTVEKTLIYCRMRPASAVPGFTVLIGNKVLFFLGEASVLRARLSESLGVPYVTVSKSRRAVSRP